LNRERLLLSEENEPDDETQEKSKEDRMKETSVAEKVTVANTQRKTYRIRIRQDRAGNGRNPKARRFRLSRKSFPGSASDYGMSDYCRHPCPPLSAGMK